MEATLITTLPIEFLKRLEKIVPNEHFDQTITSFELNKPVAIRVNRLKSSVDEIKAKLKALYIPFQPVSWYEDALLIDFEDKPRLTHADFYNNGECYIQSLSSLLPVVMLDPQPGEEILDLCAAPGSKTTQMASLMTNQGRIAAVEKSKHRFFKLQANLKKQAATCVDTYLKDGAKVWRYCENRFDRVLVDAPCSSEGRFTLHNAESYSYWTQKKIKQMARIQWQVLQSGFLCLKPGGTLVYSTCTFAPEENEAILNKLLKRFPGQAEIVSCDLPVDNCFDGITYWNEQFYAPEVARSKHILPNETFDGFFVCKITKK
ncbi:MAG: RsmB/NOP family class I SAM-dependent RNA methyltransferase [Coxiellaceae bacterium]|nr:RsmB/NOP family class I SAM-dependent RNA methyltransferase [Coxiellaceae bacterium]